MAKARGETPGDAREKRRILTTDDLVKMPVNELLCEISGVMDRRGEPDDKALARIVNEDIQRHIDALPPRVRKCPECGGTIVQRAGKRNGLQRYRCASEGCGRYFTETSGTILEKTRFSWDAWVEVVYQLINWNSVADTLAVLADDYHYPNADEKSVWLMRLKVMNALASLPSPVLTGVVQVDDTFLREAQKGSRSLFNPLPASFDKPRLARTKKNPKAGVECGPQGNEYACVTCAVDASGRCVVRTLGMGALSYEDMSDFLGEHTRGVSFICSDGALSIAKYCDVNCIPHYIYPSNYRDIRDKAGWAHPREGETEAQRESRRKHNRAIAEPMWRDGTGPCVVRYPRGERSYDAFLSVCDEFGLTVNGVNSLHSSIKDHLDGDLRGVSTRYLPLYLALCEHLWNAGIEKGGGGRSKVVSRKDAEDLLVEAVCAQVNLTASDISGMRARPPMDATVSGRQMARLRRETARVREKLGNAEFVFDDGIGVEVGDKKEYLLHLPPARLWSVCEHAGLRKWKTQKNNKTMLAIRLLKLDDLERAIEAERLEFQAAAPKSHSRALPKPAERHENRRPVRSTFPASMFTTCREAAARKARVVFLDTETTGLVTSTDEVLSVAMVSLDGEVLLDELVRPRHRLRWDKAEEVNGISPADVEGAPSMPELKERVEGILREADVVAGWNVLFDMKMLYAAGIDFPDRFAYAVDLLADYKAAWASGHPGRKRKPAFDLASVASRHGLSHAAHTALGDVAVLVPIWEMLAGGADAP